MPLVIVGAPRSGTNLLRDLLCQAPGLATWPCDEINLVWRHGNVRYPDDALPAAAATAKVRSYVRRCFNSIAERHGAHIVVEKTCANSLRLPFVDRILPDARYIQIVRDGRDATMSAIHRWRAPFEPLYTLRKLRYVPRLDIPFYAFGFMANRLGRVLDRDQRLAWWGPKIPEFRQRTSGLSLDAICALQWSECVSFAAAGLRQLPDRHFTVRYEELVRQPREVLEAVFSFLGLDGLQRQIDVSSISDRSIGRGGQDLRELASTQTHEILRPMLGKLGYD